MATCANKAVSCSWPWSSGVAAEIRQFFSGDIGNGFQTIKRKPLITGEAAHRGGFHIDQDRTVRGCKVALFFREGHVVDADEAQRDRVGFADAPRGGEPLTCGCVDDFIDHVCVVGLHTAGECAGPSDGDQRGERALLRSPATGTLRSRPAHARTDRNAVEVVDLTLPGRCTPARP